MIKVQMCFKLICNGADSSTINSRESRYNMSTPMTHSSFLPPPMYLNNHYLAPNHHRS